MSRRTWRPHKPPQQPPTSEDAPVRAAWLWVSIAAMGYGKGTVTQEQLREAVDAYALVRVASRP